MRNTMTQHTPEYFEVQTGAYRRYVITNQASPLTVEALDRMLATTELHPAAQSVGRSMAHLLERAPQVVEPQAAPQPTEPAPVSVTDDPLELARLQVDAVFDQAEPPVNQPRRDSHEYTLAA